MKDIYQVLSEALEYYANGENYGIDDPHETARIYLNDEGERAAEALGILRDHVSGQMELLAIEKVKASLIDFHKKVGKA